MKRAEPNDCFYLTGFRSRLRPLKSLETSTTTNPRVPHISLVFREIWGTTNLNLYLRMVELKLLVERSGLPHLAKNERDVGHPAFVAPKDYSGVTPEVSTLEHRAVFQVRSSRRLLNPQRLHRFNLRSSNRRQDTGDHRDH